MKNKINTYKIDRNKLGKKPIGRIIECEEDFHDNRFNNIVTSFLYGQNPILIKTNLSQSQWNDFCDGKLSKKELDKYI